MGFWSGLAKIAGPVAGLAAAPFTAGATLPLVLGAAGSAVGAAANGAAQNRGAQNALNMDRDQQRLQAQTANEQALENRGRLELDTQQADRTSQADAYMKALKSALALNMGDVSMNRPQGIPEFRFSGGPRPSAIGAQGKQAAELLNAQALQKLMNGEQHTPLPALQKFEQTPEKKASIWEKIAGFAAPALTAAGQIMGRGDDDEGSPVSVADYIPQPVTQSSGLFKNVRF